MGPKKRGPFLAPKTVTKNMGTQCGYPYFSSQFWGPKTDPQKWYRPGFWEHFFKHFKMSRLTKDEKRDKREQKREKREERMK